MHLLPILLTLAALGLCLTVLVTVLLGLSQALMKSMAASRSNREVAIATDAARQMVETLKGEGPFTVFAPTDEAFAALPEGTVEGLLKDIPKLTEILKYHVVNGAVPAADVAVHKNITTLQGQDVKVDAAKWHLHKNPKINDANVLKTDVMADNGVIHVIDKVLIPK